MMLNARNPSHSRKGVLLILLAISLIAVVATLAISLDGGVLMSQRRHAQATADAAALAGASQLYYDYFAPQRLEVSAALSAASMNGYTNDGVTSLVTVNSPPKSGNYVGRYGFIEVIVQYNQPRGFSSLFGSGTIPIVARSVAIGSPYPANVGILVLDPSASGALGACGPPSPSIIITGAPIVVDSANVSGAITNGGAVIAAPSFYFTGGYDSTGNSSFQGTINTSSPPMPDPFQYLPAPDPSNMSVRSTKGINLTNGTTTLYPGVYTGGIDVSGSGNLNLTSGIYYINSGGFSFSGQGSLNGTGVLIYNVPGSSPSNGISISGNGTMNLTGMQSGIYQGMTLWQAQGSTAAATIAGNGTSSMMGTFYFPSATLNVSGNGYISQFASQMVSNQLNVSGNGTVNVVWNPNKVALPRMIALVE